MNALYNIYSILYLPKLKGSASLDSASFVPNAGGWDDASGSLLFIPGIFVIALVKNWLGCALGGIWKRTVLIARRLLNWKYCSSASKDTVQRSGQYIIPGYGLNALFFLKNATQNYS